MVKLYLLVPTCMRMINTKMSLRKLYHSTIQIFDKCNLGKRATLPNSFKLHISRPTVCY